MPICTGDTSPSDGPIQQNCTLFTNTGRSSTLANMHVEGCMTAICLRLLYDVHPMLRPGHWTAHNRSRPLFEDSSLAVEKCDSSLLQPYSTSTRGLESHGFTTIATPSLDLYPRTQALRLRDLRPGRAGLPLARTGQTAERLT